MNIKKHTHVAMPTELFSFLVQYFRQQKYDLADPVIKRLMQCKPIPLEEELQNGRPDPTDARATPASK